ncbi:Hint domain-containing protein [Nioella ostreopsis]|uniref:Hint domain-containing protein n=1 Tax=Nioella ostreopsis TaxID=2448479 RepID=UPI0013E0C684|nr:Hint domain-containing protein [Nioella ostreopsis]
METYDYDYLINYNPVSGTSYSQSYSSGPQPRSLGAGPDSTFQLGELTFNSNYPFLGSITIPLSAGGTIELPVTGGDGTEIHLYLPAGLTPADVTLPAFIDTSTLNTANLPVCFLAGSLVSIPGGARAVEDLQIGDEVLALDGRKVSIKWIGRQTVSTRFGPAERLMPVRFAAGSLGDGLPQSDLTVTADHGMLVDGVICHAGALVDGTTITRVPLEEMGERYTVYHIETEAHEIILANGAPAETFIDNVSRRTFDNYAEFEALYGDVPEMEELPYPRAMSARQVPVRILDALDTPRCA